MKNCCHKNVLQTFQRLKLPALLLAAYRHLYIAEYRIKYK